MEAVRIGYFLVISVCEGSNYFSYLWHLFKSSASFRMRILHRYKDECERIICLLNELTQEVTSLSYITLKLKAAHVISPLAKFIFDELNFLQ